MGDIRNKFITDAMKSIEGKEGVFNDWEKTFVIGMKNMVERNIDKVSTHQFNSLMDIKNKYSKIVYTAKQK